LVNCPEKSSRMQNSMSGRRVARVLLLLKATSDAGGQEAQLAYVQWFQTVGAVDPHNGMYHLKRAKTFAFIEVERIERVVHLIPKFTNRIGAAKAVYDQITRHNSEFDRDACVDSDAELGMRRKVDVFDYYEDFWLNVWVDYHLYNSVY
jgi:hypothetical protein